ncbi:neuroblastoma amplified sequence [Schistosoma japonicum]|nr:neuroblastoma amplified sequence [Schistosoma japonicum]
MVVQEDVHIRSSDRASDIMKSDELDRYPHIVEELAEWSISVDSKLSADNSHSVAVDLLRCRNISLSSVHPSATFSSDDSDETPSSSHPKINYFFYNTWRKVSEALTTWFPPSQILITYSYLRENNCPWQLGYLSSDFVQGQALCLVATHWIELMELPNRLQSSNSSSSKDLKESVDITPSELIQSPTINLTHSEPDVNQVIPNHSSKATRKWYLSYVDPSPQWRVVSFLYHKPCETFEPYFQTNNSNRSFDNLHYITAIGYSNGSVDIIDLSIDENEKPDINQNIRRSRIFIPPPFTQSNYQLGCKKPLFPIVLLSFIDVSHLLVGHLRGHIDLWHLDWKAQSFPARMMVRIYPTSVYGASKPPLLLAAVYDSSSNLLVLSTLPNANAFKLSKSMHRKLGLTCYCVSKKAPYLVPTSSYSTSDRIPSTLMSFFSACKDVSVNLLCNLFRHNYYLSNDSQDAVMSMVLANFNTTSLPTFSSSDASNQLLLGSLQASGSYSVWLIPSFELLLLIANPEINPSLSANETFDICCRPFRIAWWSRPLESDELVGHDIQLCVLHENGSIDLLDIKKCGTDFYPKVARKLPGLNLPSFPVFATRSTLPFYPTSCLSEVVLLSSCLKPDSETKVGSHDLSKSTPSRHYVRCTRLKSTTHTGLFDHFIRMGKFQKALELSGSNKESSEIVYKQMWTKLSCEFWKLKDFEQFIHSTLDAIEIHPLWVIKQCLNYLPRYVPLSVNYNLLLSNIRLTLNYGLNILTNRKHFSCKDDIWCQSVRDRLLTYLAHVNCVDSIIQTELLIHPSNESINLSLINQETGQPCVKVVLEALVNFRARSLLDIAFGYARCEEFIALNVLCKHFPRSVGSYRLAIASSLSETINPGLYFDKIFSLLSHLPNDEPYLISDMQGDYNRNIADIQCNFSVPLYLDLESSNNPLKLVKILSKWLIERSLQIDSRSGLTDYALLLICLGSSTCEELLKEHTVDSEVEKCLISLKKVRRDFIELSQIVYNKSISPTAILNISTETTNLLPREFTNLANNGIRAFQFKMEEFQRFDSKSILNLLLRIILNLTNSSILLDTTTASDKLVSYVVYQLLPHLAEKCTTSDYCQLINYTLLCAANYTGLTGHFKLLESIKLGSFKNQCDYLSTNLPDVLVLNTYRLLMGLVYVLYQYEPNCKVNQLFNHESTVSLSTYLNDANHLVNSMLTYCQNSKLILQHANVAEYGKLLQSIQLICRFASALLELQSLLESIEKRIGSPVSLPFNFIGCFYRCSYDAGYFRSLLNSWIQIFSRFALAHEHEVSSTEILPDCHNRSGIHLDQRPQISQSTVKELSNTFYQFYNILSKAFRDCPSELWLKIGLQYALFASGNEYFLELSRNFCLDFSESHLNLHKTTELSESSLQNWGICLLNAIRTYVNTSIPIRSKLKMVFTTDSSSLSHITDPNERLARYCLLTVDSLRNQINWRQSLLLEFYMEKCLLDASTYLSTVNTMLPSNKCLPSVSPFRLRHLWSNQYDVESNEKRYHLLVTTFSKLIELFSTENMKSTYDSAYVHSLFDSTMFNNLATSFVLTVEQVNKCFIFSLFNHLQNNDRNCIDTGLLNLTYKLLNHLIEVPVESCWFECAIWAGYNSEIFNPNSTYTTTMTMNISSSVCNVDNKLYSWTYLHALHNIERPKYPISNMTDFVSMNVDPMELWNVERYRLRLARFALAHCSSPKEHLYDLSDFVGLCTLRLEWISMYIIILNGKEKGISANILPSSLFKRFSKFISNELKRPVTKDHSKRITLHLPPFYSESSFNLFSELTSNTFDALAPIDRLSFGAEEHRLWFLFLFSWARCNPLNIYDHANPNIVWSKATLEVANRDTRLSISYSAIGSKFCQLSSSTLLSYSNYINEISILLLPFLESSNYAEDLDTTCRIVLVLLCYTLVSIYESKTDEYSFVCGCFPSGKYLCSKCCSFITSKEFSQKFDRLHKQLVNTFTLSLRESLISRLVNKFPGIDFVRFRNDRKYREDTIYGLCSTNFSLGLRLCSCYNLSQREGVFCRLECLFRDEDCMNCQVKQEINKLIKWFLALPNGLEMLLNRANETIYPFTTQLSHMKLFFDMLPDDCESHVFDGLKIQMHRRLLDILSKIDDADKFFNCLSYPEFLRCLRQSTELHNHSLFNYIRTECDAIVVANVVEHIQTDNNDNIMITSLQAGDIYAIFGLRVFYDMELFQTFTTTSNLLRLFQSIASGNSPNDVCRFINWLEVLLYGSAFSNNLSVDQRRLVLKMACTFVSSKTVANSVWSKSDILEKIKFYASHFEQILYLLNKILFPQEDTISTDENIEIDLNENFQNKFSLPKKLYKKLICIEPNNQFTTSEFLKELIFAVIMNNVDTDMSSTSVCLKISTKLQTLGRLLPPCLKTLKIENEHCLQTDLCYHQMSSSSSTTGMFVNTQVQTIYPYLNEFLNLFVNDDIQHETLNDTYLVDSKQLLACFLTDSTIRRLFGNDLLKSYSDIDNDWEESTLLNVVPLFTKTLKYLQKSVNCKLLSNLLSEKCIQLLHSDDNVDEFKKCFEYLFQQTHEVNNVSEDSSLIIMKENAEILRSVIELVDLIVMDDMLPGKSDFLQHLWTLWYQYCEKSGLFFVDNGLYCSSMLLHEWTKCCLPPVEFSKAGLKILSHYYTTSSLEDSMGTHPYPPIYQAAIVNVALLQSDSAVINSLLSVLSTVKEECMLQYLDSSVCCYFICSHYRRWLSLACSDPSSPIVSRKLFSKMFTSLIHFLQFNNHGSYHKIGRIICRLLRDENMWLEAAIICTVIHSFRPGSVPIEYLMKLVNEL